MTYDLLSGLALFAFVSSITPGPNNLMLMASGANFGVRRTLPHMLGVALGFVFMAILMGLGLSRAFEVWPWLYDVFLVVSVVYLGWLAWKIAHAAAPGEGRAGGKPLAFLQAAAFQWVNPKAWAMAITAVTVYTPEGAIWAVWIVAVVFGAINLPSVSVWTVAGERLARVLTNRRRLRAFNLAMATLLIASMLPALF